VAPVGRGASGAGGSDEKAFDIHLRSRDRRRKRKRKKKKAEYVKTGCGEEHKNSWLKVGKCKSLGNCLFTEENN
jgi:hypothetical protein